jgi:ABC-type sugar transport system ATPase subunit
MVKVKNVHLRFANFAIQDASFHVKENEFFTILGPSGSGKSCLLRTIVGMYKVNDGEIYINNREVHNLPPEDRNIGFAMQDSALFPNMTVFGNIAFGLKIRKMDSKLIKKKVHEISELFHVTHLLDRSVTKLSGGESQRISFARALIIDPEVLLLDEPFSKLDKVIHDRLLIEIKKILSVKKVTVINVTHDQDEAHYLSDRIAIINNGKIIQVDSINNLFNRPNSKFVADFVDIKNVYKGKIHRND